MGIAFDFTITLSSLIETSIFVSGGIYALAILNTTVVSLKAEVSTSKHETRKSISGLQEEIKKIGEVLINQADQNRRIIHLEDDVRELRHGRGFIQGSRGIDHEYSSK